MFNIYGILIWASRKPQKIEKNSFCKSPPVKIIPSPAKFLFLPPLNTIWGWGGGGGGFPPSHLLMLFGKPWQAWLCMETIYYYEQFFITYNKQTTLVLLFLKGYTYHTSFKLNIVNFSRALPPGPPWTHWGAHSAQCEDIF